MDQYIPSRDYPGITDRKILVFAGQGTTSSGFLRALEQARHDSSESTGSLLLSACHEAFLTDIASLHTSIDGLGIDTSDFREPSSLLSSLPDKYPNNAIISGINLFLAQTLRVLSHFAQIPTSLHLQDSPSHTLIGANTHELLAFSSGIFPAIVVASSYSPWTYISRAVSAFRLVLLIGVRVEINRRKWNRDFPPNIETDRRHSSSWSVVTHGISKTVALQMVSEFNATMKSQYLHVTAVLDDQCVTISGHPYLLTAFVTSLPPGISFHETPVHALYHSSANASIRDSVMADTIRLDIHFPTFSDIKVPIRSTLTGEPLQEDGRHTLLELVVDSILVHPVNWNLTLHSISKSYPRDSRVQLVNVGPGSGLLRYAERSMSANAVPFVSLDIASSEPNSCRCHAQQQPIAIVGMAINMPGAPDAKALWSILEQGMNTVSEIPNERFRISEYSENSEHSSQTTGRYMKANTGNFIRDPDVFDNEFFMISPREAQSLDPQQRILLHTAYEALENAGYVPNSTSSFQSNTFGIYIGSATGDYAHNLRNNIDVYYSIGTLRAFQSGRISHALRLGGPSVVIDTACSSSIVAMHQACRSLSNGDCSAALAGGVNIITSPDMFIGLDRGHFLSPTGQCRPFDASADGYCRGEGCGVFVLKRLDDAVAENDNILGIIRGIEVNQSGLSPSITHPHSPTQANLLGQLLRRSGVNPHSINAVEAHGTGTQAGDPAELASIRFILSRDRQPENPLHVMSLKANIGHLEAASGAAGLAKLVLMLKHRTIPPQISLTHLNPNIPPFENDNVVIPRECLYWRESFHGRPRVALLNNFGASGSNAAVIIEEYLQSPHTMTEQPSKEAYVVGLSAKTETSLSSLRDEYIRWLDTEDGRTSRLVDIAYTATARRQQYRFRLAVTATDPTDLAHQLEKAPFSQVPQVTPNVAFVFSGQGVQYRGMGSSLYHGIPIFRRAIDQCHSILTDMGFPGVLSMITSVDATGRLSDTEEIQIFQTAMFSLQYSIAQVYKHWGIVPKIVAGHSIGEYAAQVVAGVLTLKDALSLVANRASLLVTHCTLGESGMLAVNISPDACLQHLSRTSLSLISIACFNGPTNCVLSGPLDQLEELKTYLDQHSGSKAMLLSVPFGYHSHVLQPIAEGLTAVSQRISKRAPTIPIISNVLGKMINPGNDSVFTDDYYHRHCVEPVRFEQGLHSLEEQTPPVAVDVWIEIGPHTTILPMLRSNSATSKAMLLPSLRKSSDPWTTLSSSLASLYKSGVAVQWRKTFDHCISIRCISLPAYQFSKKRYWVSFQEEATVGDKSQPAQGISGSRETFVNPSEIHPWFHSPSYPSSNSMSVDTPLSLLTSLIRGHIVVGQPLCPASIYIELAVACIESLAHSEDCSFVGKHAVLRNIEFVRPLVVVEPVQGAIRTSSTLSSNEGGYFTIMSHVDSSEQVLHCSGSFKLVSMEDTNSKMNRVSPSSSRLVSALLSSPADHIERFLTHTIYNIVFSRVVKYSDEYQTIKVLSLRSDGTECYAEGQLPERLHCGGFVVHPILVDGLLHVAGFLLNFKADEDDVFVCTKIESVKLVPESIDVNSKFGIFVSSLARPGETVAYADVCAFHLHSPEAIVARLKGIHFRRLRIDVLKRSLSNAVLTHRIDSTVATSSPGSPNSVAQSRLLRHKELSRTQALMEAMPPSIDGMSPTNIRGQRLHTTSNSSTTRYVEAARIPALFASVLGMKQEDIGDDMELESLGLDSLASIEALHALRTNYDLDLPFNFFSLHRTLQSVQTHIRSLQGRVSSKDHDFKVNPPFTRIDGHDEMASAIATSKAIISEERGPILLTAPLQNLEMQKSAPLLLIHDGSGFARYAARLTHIGRSVWTMENPRASPHTEPWSSIEEMADHYVHHIAEVFKQTMILGGWSFGGVVAFEMACQLLRRGFKVRGVILIDSPCPIDHVPLPEDLINFIVDQDRYSSTNLSAAIAQVVKSQFQRNSALLSRYNPDRTPNALPQLVLLRSREGYDPKGVTETPRWLKERSDAMDIVSEWQRFTGSEIKVIDIPGNHFSAFDPINIKEISQYLLEACDYLDL
uniref:PKS1 n=1 Tax=Agaricomycetes sp. TaxID=1709932 RepID=A0A1L3MZ74_9AGAM|nr:PKS1 [Agaricomycetes sp.]